MKRHSDNIKKQIQNLRSLGKTFTEINSILKTNFPKSTLFSWCKDVILPKSYAQKIIKLNQKNLKKSQKIAWKVNQNKRKLYLEQINQNNIPIALKIRDNDTSMIALAMLCLGEASKSKTKHKSFSFGNSDPRIIIIFLYLLKNFESFDTDKIRCTVQCRADQNTLALENYWQKITKVSKKLFYPTRIDPRTIGKSTKNKNYHGVLVIDYYDRNIQLTLESLANIVYNLLTSQGPIA